MSRRGATQRLRDEPLRHRRHGQLYPRGVRLRAESVLAWAAAAVGLISVASAMTPEIANRARPRPGRAPAGRPSAARVAALAFGLALVWLSRSLARRRRRAWQLAVALVVGDRARTPREGPRRRGSRRRRSLLLVALVRYRRRFDVPGRSVDALRPLLGIAVRRSPPSAGVTAWLAARPGARTGSRTSLAARDLLSPSARSTSGCAPSRRARAPDRRGAARRARRLVEAYGYDSLAFFTLRRDKSYFFSPSRRAFLAYRVVAGAALVSGDPVGDDDELDALLDAVPRLARARGWRRRGSRCERGEQLARYRSSRPARDQARRRGRPSTRRLLARGPGDPQGAPVGHAPRPGGLPRSRRPRGRGRSTLSARSSTRSRTHGAAAQPERGFSMAHGRPLRRPGHALRGRRATPTGASAVSSTSRPRRRPAATR